MGGYRRGVCLSTLLTSLNDRDKKAIYNVAKALSYFVKERAYGYIDRLANAFSISTARHVLEEALRDLASLKTRGEEIYMPSKDDIERILNLVEKDLSILKVITALALSEGW